MYQAAFLVKKSKKSIAISLMFAYPVYTQAN